MKTGFCSLFLILFSGPLFAEPAGIWQEYEKNPNSHAQIPNNSYAGFSYGEKRVDLYSDAPSLNVMDFGAKGDGVTDDTQAIKKAISSMKGDGPVRIFFPSGTYLVSDQILVKRSFTALVGESREKTKILFSRPLKKILNEKWIGSTSPFAWSRGLIEFRPEAAVKMNGWGAEKVLTGVSGDHQLGSFELRVEPGRRFSPGTHFLRWDLAKSKNVLNFMAGLPQGEVATWGEEAKHWKDRKYIFWPVEITRIERGVAFLKQPLRLPVTISDSVQILAAPELLTGIGLGNITISTKRERATEHLREEGYNGIFIHRALNGFVHNVDVENVDNGLILNAVKNLTASKVRIVGKLSTHHGFFHKYAEDILVEDFEIASPMIHGINADLRGSGNVWRRGKMKFGTFDLHRGMQFDNIRTFIEINNTGNSGGDVDAGPMQGRRVVHWNINITNKRLANILQPEYFPFGAMVGIQGVMGFSIPKATAKNHPKILYLNERVQPEDLYQAQIDLRLKR